MTTKKDFNEMWYDSKVLIKKIRLMNEDIVYADKYFFSNDYDYVTLKLGDVIFGIFNLNNIKGIESD